jgi:hypothetical protein
VDHHLTRVVLESNVPAQGTAGTAQARALGASPIAGKITDVTIVPEAAVAANGTNFRNFRLVNKAQDGSGTTVIGATDTSAASLVAYDERVLTLTPANVNVAQGDVLAADETVAGTGVAHGGYKIIVEITRS